MYSLNYFELVIQKHFSVWTMAVIIYLKNIHKNSTKKSDKNLSIIRFLSFNLVSVRFRENLIWNFFAIFENCIAIFVERRLGIISFMTSTSGSGQSGRANRCERTRIRFTVIDDSTIESIAYWKGS